MLNIFLIVFFCSCLMGAFLFVGASSVSYEQYRSQHKGDKQKNKANDSPPESSIDVFIFFSCEAAFAEANNGLISALATIVIATFTVALAYSTRRQAHLTADIIALTREDFISTHRPKIILRDAAFTVSKITYTLVNTGSTKATLIESSIITELLAPGTPLRTLRSSGKNDIGPLVFEGGELKELIFDPPENYGFFISAPNVRYIATETMPRLDNHRLYFVGVLLYSDNMGVKRRSVFRRQWSDSSKSFIRVGDPDQEYAD